MSDAKENLASEKERISIQTNGLKYMISSIFRIMANSVISRRQETI